MKYINQILNVLRFINNSREAVEKTYIQKGIFLLQEGLGMNLDLNYKIHFYGPYSEDLTEILYELESMNFLRINNDDQNERYEISVMEEGINFINSEKGNFEVSDDKFTQIRKLIGESSVEDMELLSTTLYFSKLVSKDTESINLTQMAKPHFSKDQIRIALETLKESKFI